MAKPNSVMSLMEDFSIVGGDFGCHRLSPIAVESLELPRGFLDTPPKRVGHWWNVDRIEWKTGTYDAMDRRIGRVFEDLVTPANNEETVTVHRGDHAYLEVDTSGATASVSERYLYGAAVDQILAVDDGTDVFWGLGDHQGTVRDVIDSTGSIDEHRTYDSFGKQTSLPSPTVDFVFGYTGRPLDEATDLYNYRARWYDPSTGRFASEDPAGFLDGTNAYRYVGNNPMTFTDPTGMWSYDGTGANGGSAIASGYGSSDSWLATSDFFGTVDTTPTWNVPDTHWTPLVMDDPGPPSIHDWITSSPLEYDSGMIGSIGWEAPAAPVTTAPVDPGNMLAGLPPMPDGYQDRFSQPYQPPAGLGATQKPSPIQVYNPVPSMKDERARTRAMFDAMHRGVDSAANWYEDVGVNSGNRAVAAVIGFQASLARSVGGAVVSTLDVDGSIEAGIEDVCTSIDYGRKHGVAVGIGRQIGVSQIAEAYIGVDIQTGQAVNRLDKIAEASGRIGSTAGTAAGGLKMTGWGKGAPTTASPLSRNLMGADDLTGQYANNIKPKAGYYDVIAHGGPDSIDVVINGRTIPGVNHRTAARLIQNSSDYAGQNIRLVSCNTGSLPDGFAKNLANKMNVDVVAPNQLLFPKSDGTFIISGGRTIDGVTYPILPATGQMVPFSPGKP